MAVDLSSAKDWVYVICLPIQTLFGLVFLHWWWDRRKRKEDRRKADKEREEDKQRADAEKIAAILSENYFEIEKTFHRLRQNVDILRKKTVVGNYTEFDLLIYMCLPENQRRFENTNGNRHVQDSPTNTTIELLSDVEEIMKFFLKFRINLFAIMQNKACPDDIKSVFASKITEMGKTIYPFVEEHKQDVIDRVLTYFVHSRAEAPSPNTRACGYCFTLNSIPVVSRCCRRPRASETPRLIQDDGNQMYPINRNQQPELPRCPDISAIESAIPYCTFLRYEDGKIINVLGCKYFEIKTLEKNVEKGAIDETTSNCILGEIKKFLPDEGDDLLHSLRMVIFKLSYETGFDKNQSFLDFVTHAKYLVKV